MNDRNEVVQQTIEWSKNRGTGYTIKEKNSSDRFRATIQLNQNLSVC